jgi:hypothetical protein
MSRDVICVVWLDYADTNNYVLVENLVCVHCVVTNHFLSGPFLWSVSRSLTGDCWQIKAKTVGSHFAEKNIFIFLLISH